MAGYWNSNRKRKQSPQARAVSEGYRSGLEDTLGADLNNREIGAVFEAGAMKYTIPARVAEYTPDFFLRRDRGNVDPLPADWFKDEDWWKVHFVVESKGRFMPDDRKKHLLIKEQYPFSDIKFVFDKKTLKSGKLSKSGGSDAPIYKGSKTTYGKWATKNGFIWADARIPEEWFDEV